MPHLKRNYEYNHPNDKRLAAYIMCIMPITSINFKSHTSNYSCPNLYHVKIGIPLLHLWTGFADINATFHVKRTSKQIYSNTYVNLIFLQKYHLTRGSDVLTDIPIRMWFARINITKQIYKYLWKFDLQAEIPPYKQKLPPNRYSQHTCEPDLQVEILPCMWTWRRNRYFRIWCPFRNTTVTSMQIFQHLWEPDLQAYVPLYTPRAKWIIYAKISPYIRKRGVITYSKIHVNLLCKQKYHITCEHDVDPDILTYL